MTSSILRQTDAREAGGPAIELAPFLGTIALAIAAVGVTGSSFMFLAPLLIGVALIGTLLWRGSLLEWIAGWAIGLGISTVWLGPAMSVDWVSWVGAGLVFLGLVLVVLRFRQFPPSPKGGYDGLADRIGDNAALGVIFLVVAGLGSVLGGILMGVFTAMLGA